MENVEPPSERNAEPDHLSEKILRAWIGRVRGDAPRKTATELERVARQLREMQQ
jgi:hypothetical protein